MKFLLAAFLGLLASAAQAQGVSVTPGNVVAPSAATAGNCVRFGVDRFHLSDAGGACATSASAAPSNAHYLTTQAESGLSAETVTGTGVATWLAAPTGTNFDGLNLDRFTVSATACDKTGVSDATSCIASLLNAANLDTAGSRKHVIYFPSGTYLIDGSTLPSMTTNVCLVGDGAHQTFIKVGPNYSGDVFSWSEAWFKSAFNGTALTVANDFSGPCVKNLTVTGDSSASNTQNAFVFYGRNDDVFFDNVRVYFMHGQALAIGKVTGGQTQGYMRESSFRDMLVWGSGTASLPAVEISTVATSGSDSTNELDFFKLRIFGSAGEGLLLHNPTAFGSVRAIQFYTLSVEQSGKHNVEVGLPADTGGQIAGVRFYGLESISPPSTYCGFIIDPAQQSYDIFVLGGQIGPGAGCGVDLENTRLTKVQIENITTSGTNVILGASLGSTVVLDGNGSETTWTYSINAAAVSATHVPLLSTGDPSHNQAIITRDPGTAIDSPCVVQGGKAGSYSATFTCLSPYFQSIGGGFVFTSSAASSGAQSGTAELYINHTASAINPASITGGTSGNPAVFSSNTSNAPAKFSGNGNGNTVIGSSTSATQVGGSLAVTTTASVADDAYAAGWDASTNVPTKNAVYDKIQTLTSLSGTTGSIGGGALLAGACTSGTVSVTSSTTAMAVAASPVTYPGDGAYWMGYVSSAGTVTVKVCAAVALTPTASAYNVRVLQ